MEWRLEVVFVPVSDVNRAKLFYRDQVGFNEDFDSKFGNHVRMVQLTPPGSGCSIALLTGMAAGRPGSRDLEPGSLNGLQIVVPDINAARAKLIENGVDVSEVMEVVHDDSGWAAYHAVMGNQAAGTLTLSSTTPTATGGFCSKARKTNSPGCERSPIQERGPNGDFMGASIGSTCTFVIPPIRSIRYAASNGRTPLEGGGQSAPISLIG